MEKYYVICDKSKRTIILVCASYRMAYEQLIRVKKVSAHEFTIGIIYK